MLAPTSMTSSASASRAKHPDRPGFEPMLVGPVRRLEDPSARGGIEGPRPLHEPVEADEPILQQFIHLGRSPAKPACPPPEPRPQALTGPGYDGGPSSWTGRHAASW